MYKQYYVYILANLPRGALYVGVTSNLLGRVWQHKNKVVPGHTKKYGIDRLVYYEVFYDVRAAIAREKQLKRYVRQWKYNLIEERNPHWEEIVLTP
ncbi:MAG: GIY-YIG nuclease family protein [Sphingomonadales bacterium]